ncbi:Ras-like GTP-binding protein Rho1 [Tribolium castaneum]|uniref:Ras-like GTP-binding protein Rho1 n=1 Tax=Tribolium castaneum TaxID=7070 RepID=D6W7P9_TRICA|nr:Ras-like GTP-binding protein Rho1 [Tribolium castaneum]
MSSKKIVVIGDGACGKTSLSVAFSQNEFPETHVPTIYDTYTKTITVDEQNVELTIWDTAGEEDYDRLRPLSYTKASVIIVCFTIDNPVSLKNVKTRWAPEVKHFCRKVPILLVGNKLDLRNNKETVEDLKRNNMQPVKFEQGLKVSKKIGARKYIECSAKHMVGVQDVFRNAARIALKTPQKKGLKRLCRCVRVPCKTT